MIMPSLPAALRSRVLCVPIEDSDYNITDWVQKVQRAAAAASDHFGLSDARISLIGHSKDRSSYYLRMFPQWESTEVGNQFGLSATPFRQHLYEEASRGTVPGNIIDANAPFLPEAVASFLREFVETNEFRNLVLDYEADLKRNTLFNKEGPAPTFVTAQAVVTQAGSFVLCRRRSRPGLGLWCLPKVYVERDEYVSDAIMRAIEVKTNIKVPTEVLRGSTTHQQLFDHPYRSSRGRVICHTGLTVLKPKTRSDDPKRIRDELALPKLRGPHPDAEARWFTIAEIENMRPEMFEDSLAQINVLRARIEKE